MNRRYLYIEKSKQVPHMGLVYSLASQVVIWLGPNDLVDQHREQIDSLLKHIESLSRLQCMPDFDKPPFSEQDRGLWIAIASMQCSSWFQRFWTVQELCLARHMNVLCARCFVFWGTLDDLLRKALTVDLELELDSNLQPCGHHFQSYGHDFQIFEECRSWFPFRGAGEVLGLLDSLRGQLVSKPIDKVYGMMFLLPEALRKKIEVDYSQENEYWIAYVDLAHILLVQPGGLSVLGAAPEKTESGTPRTSILSAHLRNLKMNLWRRQEAKSKETAIDLDDWPEIIRCYNEIVSLGMNIVDTMDSKPAEEQGRYMTGGGYKFLWVDGHPQEQRTYFFTEQGRVGRGCPGDRAGDILVALYTAPALFVLRYEEGSDVATLIGEAYLDGCMDLDNMPSEGRGPDEWFTLG